MGLKNKTIYDGYVGEEKYRKEEEIMKKNYLSL